MAKHLPWKGRDVSLTPRTLPSMVLKLVMSALGQLRAAYLVGSRSVRKPVSKEKDTIAEDD